MSEQREISILTDNKLHLTLPPSKDGNTPIKLKFKFKENNITMVVDYGEKTERGYPILAETPLDPVEFNSYLELIEFVCKTKTPSSWEITNWGHPWIYDKAQGKSIRSEQRMIMSRVSIGKHDNGVIFFSVAVKGRPTTEFTFDQGEWHIYTQNGADADKAALSPLRAMAWVKTMRDVHNIEFVDEWKEPEYRRKFREEMARKHGNPGGQRQGGNSGGGGGNYNNRPPQQSQTPAPDVDMFDSDIPFD